MLKSNWFVFEDIEQLSHALAKDILKIAKQSIKLRGRFNIVLTGGTSIISLYKILSNSNSNWKNWFVYIGDERHLPSDHKDRNDKVINDIWIKGSAIPNSNIRFIKAELSMYTARSEYVEILKEVDKFDVVLLSIGEDGHVASLFPDANILDNGSVLLEYNSPKPPKERISMSYDRLNSSRNVLKIAIGQSKQQAVNLWIEDKKLPISEVHGDNEKVFLSLDSIPEVYRPYVQFNPVQI